MQKITRIWISNFCLEFHLKSGPADNDFQLLDSKVDFNFFWISKGGISTLERGIFQE